MKKIIHWMIGSMTRTYFSIAILLLGIGAVYAAPTSYNVVNMPQAYLGNSITATQTTGITLAALTRNGTTVTFPVTSGAILRLRDGRRVEDLHYTSATVNQTTKVVTLAGVTRGICWNVFSVIQTCSDGKAFSKGTENSLSCSPFSLAPLIILSSISVIFIILFT